MQKLHLIVAALAGGVCLFGGSLLHADDEKPKTTFQCNWADATITIDGKADEANWKHAEPIEDFYLPWLQEKSRAAKTKTKARLLWNRDYLYFFAEMEDGDLYANIKERDGRLWENDVFELFFKPADTKPGYYEFQVNPAGAVLDMFIPRRASGEYSRYAKDGPFHIEAKVSLNGTLNKWSDNDKGWSVEGRIPWGDFLRSGGRPAVGEVWKFALCRYDYSVDFEGPELSTCAPLKSKNRPDFHAWEDYARLKFIGPDSKNAAKPFGVPRRIALTTSQVRGSPDPLPPFTTIPAFPKLKPSHPIFVAVVPGGKRLIFIDQDRPYAKTRIRQTVGDPANGETEVLLELEDTAYSVAFHPRFAENGYIFVGSNGADEESPKKKSTRITRYTLDRKAPYKLAADSAKLIIKWPSDGHNGGAVTFGADGMLYITSGDGTSDSDIDLKGQQLNDLRAKVLRINVNKTSSERAYSIPDDNPFVGDKEVRPETWAYGFRNPWRITTDPKTGDIWVGNNGQDLWEQVYLLKRGANYGWSVFEGSHPFYPNRKLGPTPVSKPAAEHHHSESRSLTGGVVYYGRKFPDLQGKYIYGDYSTGKIWAIERNGEKVTPPIEIADTQFAISGFAIDSQGELLIIDHASDGGFYHLQRRKQTQAKHDFPRTLSASGLFEDVSQHTMKPALISYSVNSPLWSDGAHKERFIALPGGDSKIDFHPTKSWSFPDGAVLVKSFAVEKVAGDPTTRQWLETRFLTRQQGEWFGYSYAWNENQTDAALVEAEGRKIEFTVATDQGEQTRQWRFPSRSECMVCHSRAANFVLGVSTAQLNKDHNYGGVVDNQLRTLESLGVLNVDQRNATSERFEKMLVDSGVSKKDAKKEVAAVSSTRNQRAAATTDTLLVKPPSEYEKLVDPYDDHAEISARARSYLHVNCASCHTNAGGGNSQINLMHSRDLVGMKVLDEKPLHNTFKLSNPKIIAVTSPERSVLLHRMKIRGRGQMPPLATSVVDQRATELIRQWIATLKPLATEDTP